MIRFPPMRQRLVFACALVVLTTAVASRPRTVAATTPTRLTDQQFWQLSSESSEPNGYFRSDNLTSNELLFQRVIPELVATTRPGRVYLGVGPEQNFTYMAAVKPSMAIIFDIRRGNLLLQLMYKAIFELSADRADFIAMLFSKTRPSGVGVKSTVAELFGAFGNTPTSDALYAKNLKAIDDQLTVTHKLPLSAEDLNGIEYVLHAFYWNGFAVRPSPTYAELMLANDGEGVDRSFLATEDAYTFLKQLETDNLVVPVVGDFGGAKAIRAIGAYLKSHDALVSAFYLSNVEQYLSQDNKWAAFCRNVATLPLDRTSTFIRSSNRGGFAGRGFISSLGLMATEVQHCGA